jgi:hypothetical protein
MVGKKRELIWLTPRKRFESAFSFWFEIAKIVYAFSLMVSCAWNYDFIDKKYNFKLKYKK